MARKKTDEQPAMSDDTQSPDKPKTKTSKPGKSEPVKVVGGRVVKKTPARAPKKPVKPPEKYVQDPAETKPARKPRATGNTRVRNAVNLKKKEHEALQAGCLHGLDARQSKFIDLWLVTQNATQAYQDAGFECKSDAVAAAAASRLLKKVKEHPYTLAKRAELFAKTEEITARVLETVYGAAMADPRELAEVVYKCCRFCHGIDHQYQMTPHEMRSREARYEEAKAEAKAKKARIGPFDPLGGIGFDQTRDPHPGCPECNGVGERKPIIKDTRYLSPGANSLYGGWKVNKDGDVQVIVADKLPYLKMLGSIYNMNIEPVVPVAVGVTKEELDAAHARGLAKTQAQRDAMAERAAAIAAMDDEENEQ